MFLLIAALSVERHSGSFDMTELLVLLEKDRE